MTMETNEMIKQVPARPTSRHQEACNLAALKIVEMLADLDQLGDALSESKAVSDICTALAMHVSSDGYQMGKYLETYHGWTVNADIVSTLDTLARELCRAADKLVREWVITNNLTPIVRVGDMVKTKDGCGIVVEVDHRHFCVKVQTDFFLNLYPEMKGKVCGNTYAIEDVDIILEVPRGCTAN